MPKTANGELILKFVKENQDLPTLTLSKLIYSKHKTLFKDIEQVRRSVRGYRGQSGKKNKKNYPKEFQKKVRYNYNPFKMPRSFIQPQNVWKLPKGCTKVLIISDLHIPEQDNEAIISALKYGKEKGINAIFINGDLLDFYLISTHEKRAMREWKISDELEACRDFFKMLRKNFSCPIYFIPGNHDVRLMRYLRVKAPELLGNPEFMLDIILRCAEFKIEYIPYQSKCYFGKLLVEHGDKMRGTGGVNPARTLLLKFKRPVLCGHFHRTSSANSKVYDGNADMAWSTGCLTTLEPDYMQVNEHNHGAAIVEVNPINGNFRVQNFQIIDGKIY